jgi:hypothetical protein
MTINDYLKANESYIGGRYYRMKTTTAKITCKDGFQISVQASQHHYCEPREDDGPYTQVECGYPTGPVSEALQEYSEEPDTLNTIFAFVPIEIIEAELALHGGIAK